MVDLRQQVRADRAYWYVPKGLASESRVENAPILVAGDHSWIVQIGGQIAQPKAAESPLHIEDRKRYAPHVGFELRCVEARPPYGVGGQRRPRATLEEKIILLERQDGLRWCR